MPWCVECYQDGRRTITRATRMLEGDDLCDPHYAQRNREDEGFAMGAQQAAASGTAIISLADRDKGHVIPLPACVLGEYVPETPEPELEEITPLKAVEGSTMATLTDEERANRPKCTGCGATLRSDNSTGLCKPCKASSKRTGGKPGPKGPRKSPNTTKADATGDNRAKQPQACEEATESVTIELTEKRLDFIWSRLTVREKANLLFPSETSPA